MNNNGYGIIKQFQELYLKKDTRQQLQQQVLLIQISKKFQKHMELIIR